MPVEISRLVSAVEQLRMGRAELTDSQVGAMQSLDDALRGEISVEDAAEIDDVIRRGHPHGARKRLTKARRRRRQASP